jgi:hypothetical protein
MIVLVQATRQLDRVANEMHLVRPSVNLFSFKHRDDPNQHMISSDKSTFLEKVGFLRHIIASTKEKPGKS